MGLPGRELVVGCPVQHLLQPPNTVLQHHIPTQQSRKESAWELLTRCACNREVKLPAQLTAGSVCVRAGGTRAVVIIRMHVGGPRAGIMVIMHMGGARATISMHVGGARADIISMHVGGARTNVMVSMHMGGARAEAYVGELELTISMHVGGARAGVMNT